jgi:hypothetical protein
MCLIHNLACYGMQMLLLTMVLAVLLGMYIFGRRGHCGTKERSPQGDDSCAMI